MLTRYVKTIRETLPTAEPISLALAKSYLRVDVDDDDALITSMIAVARHRAEKYCNRYFADGSIIGVYSRLPSSTNPLRIPFPDVVDVTAVTYVDTDNSTQVIAGYTFDAAYQTVRPDADWPLSRGAQVTMDVGSPLDVEAATQAMLLLMSDMYEVRNTLTDHQIYTNEAAEHILYPYRVEIGV